MRGLRLSLRKAKSLGLGALLIFSFGFSLNAEAQATGHAHNRQGRYKQLLAKIECPTEYEKPGDEYLVFGFSEDPGGRYCNQKVPKRGYWVYVYPHWYIWGKEDFGAVGMAMLKKQVKLSQRSITLELAYYHPHRRWAELRLNQAAETLQDLERFTGKPFPGRDPYRIEENPDLPKANLLGQASHRDMELAPPGISSAWTLTHEGVHIWNHRTEAAWICEGLADTIGWLLMYENHFSFSKQETLNDYLDNWRLVMESDEDAPLDRYYDDLPQGKAMQYWLMLYELYGPDLLSEVLIASTENTEFNADDFRELLSHYAGSKTHRLMSGWVVRGPYYVRQARDFGPIHFPLPNKLEL